MAGKLTEGALQGEGGSAGQGLLRHHLCPALPGRLPPDPFRAPSPCPRPGCADAGHPETPGQPWSQGLPTRPSCLSHGAASAGDGPGESPMGDQEAVLPGDSSSTDLAWTPGRSSRGGLGLPRRGRGDGALPGTAARAQDGSSAALQGL